MSANPGEPEIAVVGAGISGLACGTALAAVGIPVIVLEKSRGPGGRMSTRRTAESAFDHGAQYFTVRDDRFRAVVDEWVAAGIVERWRGRIVTLPNEAGSDPVRDNGTPRYVGVPGMSAVTRTLSEGLGLRTGCRIVSGERRRARWWLDVEDGSRLGPYRALVLAIPAPQAVTLLRAVDELRARVAAVDLAGCWAVMLGYPRRLPPSWDGAFVNDGPLSWIARNNSKPGRPAAEAWVLHGSPSWSETHMEEPAEAVIEALVAEFGRIVGDRLPSPTLALAHRWRFALPREPLDAPFLFDDVEAVGVCGDWCGGPRVEGAYLSGLALGEHLARRLSR